jgi:hypothetical protein
MYKLKAYMGSGAILIFAFAIIQITAESAFCQIRIGGITITLPEKTKVLKPDRPKTEQPKAGQPGSEPRETTASGQISRLERPVATNKPMLLRETVEIKPYSQDTYWKYPKQRDYTSWVPQIWFHTFYDGSSTLRYLAEWTNPDGSPWFSEALRYIFSNQSAGLSSEHSDELMNTKAVTTTGTYGVKVTDTKTSEIIFQGKFRVKKQLFAPGDASLKNRSVFYMDNDWNLPVGYVGFNYDSPWDYPQPIAFIWFKGRTQAKDYEARLFYNGQEIASTDGGGHVNGSQYRDENCAFDDVCRFQLWEFFWDNFMLENSDWLRSRKTGAMFTRDRPGNYTVKVFYKAAQVRETTFTIDSRGMIAPNAFSSQIYLSNHRIVVPVKIIGNDNKLLSATWKNDMFYGNPLTGFGADLNIGFADLGVADRTK